MKHKSPGAIRGFLLRGTSPEAVYRLPTAIIEPFGFGAACAMKRHIRLLALLLLTRRQAPFPKTMLKIGCFAQWCAKCALALL
jgi:hypothetical protein